MTPLSRPNWLCFTYIKAPCPVLAPVEVFVVTLVIISRFLFGDRASSFRQLARSTRKPFQRDSCEKCLDLLGAVYIHT
jgi:hypothetical protein